MKKLIIPIICFLILAFVSSTSGIVFVRGGGGGGGEDYSDIVFWLNFEENDTTGTYDMGSNEHSEGDTSGTYSGNTLEGGSIVGNSGTYSLLVDAWDEYMSFSVSSNDIAPNSMRVGVWFEVTSWGNTAKIFQVIEDGDNYFGITMTGGDELEIKYGWDSGEYCLITTTNANISTGTTYVIEVILDITGDDITAELNGTVLSDGGLDCNSSSDLGTYNPGTLYIGYGESVGEDFNVGKVIVSDSLSRDIYTDFNTTVNYPG